MLMIIAMQDNPLILDLIKPKPKYDSIKLNDATRHVAIIGASLFIMASESAPYEKEEDKEKTD